MTRPTKRPSAAQLNVLRKMAEGREELQYLTDGFTRSFSFRGPLRVRNVHKRTATSLRVAGWIVGDEPERIRGITKTVYRLTPSGRALVEEPR